MPVQTARSASCPATNFSTVCTPEQMARVDVQTLDKTARELLKAGGVKAKIDYDKEGDISKKYMTPSMSAVKYARDLARSSDRHRRGA